MANAYDAKQAARRLAMEGRAKAARQRANEAYSKADLREGASGIPLGQPILVGHHSEGRHRAAIKRADSAMRRSIDQDQKADALEARADAVGTGGISADDPDAVAKLRDQLAQLQARQTFMREANKLVRAMLKQAEATTEQLLDFAARLRAIPDAPPMTDNEVFTLLAADFCGRVGFASYQLSNASANAARITKRIAQLERDAQRPTKATHLEGVCTMIEDVEANRLKLIFVGKPSETDRTLLKANGFRWAPSVGAWQRQLTNAARYSAERVLRSLEVQ